MIKVILADHQRVFRIGMASALAAEEDIRIVGQPHSIHQLMHGLENFRPHVLVISSAFMVAIDAIEPKCERQRTAILRLEDCQETVDSQLAFHLPAVVGRWADEATMVRCIRQMATGGKPISLVRHPTSASDDQYEVGLRVRRRLTSTEVRIITLVLQGYRNREIALQIATTESSIKHSLRRIFDKTGVSDRLELALFVLYHRTLQDHPTHAYPSGLVHVFRPRLGTIQHRNRSTLN